MLQQELRSIILLIISLTTFSCHNGNQSSHDFIGEWESVKFGGNDGGDFITKIEVSFKSDSTFQAIAFMVDSSSNKRSGSFHINLDSLTMIGNGEPITQIFHFSGDTLILDDVEIDSRVYLLQIYKH
ncbi:hypothetical protein [Balneola vulgaris]|uniref:hypothetical protein n=1 Tax=Balneola vulgaris TaxID=287535 RepID=UPI00035F5FAD|nr:hypothetical protein [Balneola vulgaris]